MIIVICRIFKINSIIWTSYKLPIKIPREYHNSNYKLEWTTFAEGIHRYWSLNHDQSLRGIYNIPAFVGIIYRNFLYLMLNQRKITEKKSNVGMP